MNKQQLADTNKTLPQGFSIKAHPQTKNRFVYNTKGRWFVPNQGTYQPNCNPTDEQIIRNFWVWVEIQNLSEQMDKEVSSGKFDIDGVRPYCLVQFDENRQAVVSKFMYGDKVSILA